MKCPLWVLIVGGILYSLLLLPVGLVIWLSFFQNAMMTFPPTGHTLRWYQELPQHPDLFTGLIYSLQIAAVTTVISVPLGGLAALGLSRSRVGGKALLETAFIMPLMIPAIIIGLAIYVFLFQLGLQSRVALVPSHWALVAAHVIVTLPWTFRLIYGGLTGIGRDVEKASLDLGMKLWGTLWYVTLPMLRPSIIGAFVFAFIFSFADLEISLFLVSPGTTTLPVAMVQYTLFGVDPTIAAMSTVQIVLVGALLMIGNKFVRFGEVFVGGTKQ